MTLNPNTGDAKEDDLNKLCAFGPPLAVILLAMAYSMNMLSYDSGEAGGIEPGVLR